MKHKLYLQLLADGRWARKGMYVAKSARTLRFDVELEEKTGRDYTDLVEKTFLCFSLCTSPNIGRYADQCFDRIVTAYRDRVPKDKLADFDHLYRLWCDYHLNDMTAGTKRQEECVAEIRKTNPKITYEELSEHLKVANLYEDNGYKYGHSWLCRAIPSEDIEFLKRIIEEWKEIPND